MADPDRLLAMIQALGMEAHARGGLEGGERIEMLGGRRVDGEEPTVTYRFMLRIPKKAPREGEAVHVLTDRRNTLGVVTRSGEGGRIEICVDEDLGLRVPNAVLVRDDGYLIEALRQRLKAVRRGAGIFNKDLALRVLDPERWSRPQDVKVSGEDSLTLNRDQRMAVAAMALPGVTVIWGPPGTGKTRTLASGAVESIQRGRAVALLAHTNVAVDGLLECVLDQLGPDDVPPDAVVRVGDISSPTLQARYGERVACESLVERRRAPLQLEMEELGLAISRARIAVRRHEGVSESDGPVTERFHRELEGLLQRAAALEREYDGIPARVIAEAQVVATTVHRAYLPGSLNRQMDVVVVDEASMVPLPMSVFVAGLARESVVFAGDPMQLGTITKSKAPEVRRHVTTTVFGDVTAADSSTGRGPVLLRTQYRMEPEIAQLLNHMTYGAGTLLTPTSVRQREKPRLALLTSPISYVDTSLLQPRARVPAGTWTRVNDVHAQVAVQLLAEVAGADGLGVPCAVITPYWGQARRIRRRMPRELRPFAAIDTVHRFQGSERPLVVFDVADAPGARLSKFLRIQRPGDDGARLFTVAMSRAQHHLIVVADFAFLEGQAGRFVFVRRLLEYLRAHATPIPLPARTPVGV